MDNYIDIVLQPDAELTLSRLLNEVYTKLHKVLFDLHSTSVGVSFPRCRILPGNTLRLHGNERNLNAIQPASWLGEMNGYCQVSDILKVPDKTQHRTVGRRQTTMSASKLRRLIKRGSISEDEVKQYKAKMFTKGLDNAYIELQSGSNGHKHRRYIEFGELLEVPQIGYFDQFGLSKTATVPWF